MTLPARETLRRNVAQWWNVAVSDGLPGAAWYTEANRLARSLARQAPRGVGPVRVAGVLAALSPQTPWSRNVQLARYAVRGQWEHVRTLGGSKTKARRILAGEHPLAVLGGPKVRAFFRNIARPLQSTAVCVDRHAVCLALGRHNLREGARVLALKGGYELVAEAYREVAEEAGVPAHVVQAATWVAYRAHHRGITD